MKKILYNSALINLFFTLCCIVPQFSTAQQNLRQWIEEISTTRHFETTDLFQKASESYSQLRNQLPVSRLQINHNQLDQLLRSKPAAMRLQLPVENDQVTLSLARCEIFTSDFKAGTLGVSAKDNIDYTQGIFYRGIVEGENESIVALTIFPEEISGMISVNGKNYELVKDPESADGYLLYDNKKLPSKPDFSCDVVTPPGTKKYDENNTTDGVGCKVISVYFECDYKLYQDKGSNTTNVINYVSSLFNQVATLYFNENIDIQISSIYVWTSTDPYASYTSTSNLLPAFRTTRGTNFTGNLAHFLTTRSIGGGIAYLNVLCNKSYGHAVSYIYNSFSNVPTYSWSVEVVTHELGHNIGSNHTQWCGWTLPSGGTGALDNCYTTEGGCSAGPAPTNGGTIMSYCHLTSYGINFNNGFGTQPGDKIRTSLINASCISSSGVAPTGLTTQNITNNSATLVWNASSGAISYAAQYRVTGTSTWISAGTTSSTSLVLNGLTDGTQYEWQVKTDCSVYSTTATFLTTGTSPSCNVPTSLSSTSITSSGATLSWGAVTGATTYTVQYKTAASTTWITANSTTSTSFVLSGLTASTTYNWQVKANCSGYSSSASFTTASSGCTLPNGLTTTNITRNSATLNWNASSGATNYTIRYKKLTTSRWSQISSVTGTSVNITGLTASTTYEWRVKSNCSNYTASVLFTTPAAMPESNGMNLDPISIYPNPASTELIIRFADNSNSELPERISVADLLGKNVMEITAVDQEIKVDLTGIPDGIYILQIRTLNGQVINKRFLKRQ